MLSSGEQFSRAQSCPLAPLLLKAETAYHIPLHQNLFPFHADIDIDAGGEGGKVRMFCEMGLSVLSLYCMVGGTAVYKLAIDTNAHASSFPFCWWYSRADGWRWWCLGGGNAPQ
jgi:hypothetical protein